MFRGRLSPWLIAMCLLGLLDTGMPGSLRAQEVTPTAAVERFHAVLLANMKDGKTLGFEGRRQHLDPVIKDTFDLAGMARVCTGAGWAKMSDADHERIITAFTDWTVATYAANFKDYDGESFVTKGATDDGKGNVLVETRLMLKGDPPVVFTYRMRKPEQAWRVVDIFLEGAISQMAMHRSEFAAALTIGGVDNLVKHMHELTAKAVKDGAA